MNILDQLEEAERAATQGLWHEGSWQLGQVNFEDAKLIFISRNHLRALIECAKALKMYGDRENWVDGSDGQYGALACDFGMKAREALAKLEGGEK